MGLFEDARAGHGRSLARLTTLVENDDAGILAELDRRGLPEQLPHVIGLTGPPGAGKSTIINGLLPYFGADQKIAVLLVDPSSRASGGAVLGDRVRMLDWGDERIYLRSQANRGQEGGLAPSTGALVDLFAVLGFGTILIETVGVGQDGIDIAAVCDTTVVIQSPQSGDVVQSMKAGILEIGDIFVVSKAELPGSHTTVRDLNAMVQLADYEIDDWVPKVIPVSAAESRGLDQLAAAIAQHREHEPPFDKIKRQQWETEKRASSLIRKAIRAGETDVTGREERVRSALTSALASLGQPH